MAYSQAQFRVYFDIEINRCILISKFNDKMLLSPDV